MTIGIGGFSLVAPGAVNVTISGGTVNPCKMTASQTFINVAWDGVNDAATVYTVTAGKTLFITAISASVAIAGNLKVLIDGAVKLTAAPLAAGGTQVSIGSGAATIMQALATKLVTVTGGGALGNRGFLVGYEE